VAYKKLKAEVIPQFGPLHQSFKFGFTPHGTVAAGVSVVVAI
jgi:aspartyl-tRNA synthetase